MIKTGGYLILTKHNSGTLKRVLAMAEEVACNGRHRISWEKHPDIHFIDIQEGASVIKMEQITGISQWENMYPMYSDIHVTVINHAETMSTDCQSQLLKILEDGAEHNCIFLVSEKRLIDTICNRCSIVPLSPDKESFIAEIRNTGNENIVEMVLNGRYELLLDYKDNVKSVAKKIYNLCKIKKSMEVFLALDYFSETGMDFSKIIYEEQALLLSGMYGLYEAVLLNNKPEISELTSNLNKIYDKKWIISILEKILELQDGQKVKQVTNNDFFLLVKSMAQREFL